MSHVNVIMALHFLYLNTLIGSPKAHQVSMHIKSKDRVMGAFGYLAPEYIATGDCYEKCDVYSFGVFLFELLTGQRSVDCFLTEIGVKFFFVSM